MNTVFDAHLLYAALKLFAAVLLVWILASIVFWSIRNGISPMPTSHKVKRALFKSIPKELRGTIYELGSGWGTLAFPLASELPQCRVIGMETSTVPFLFTKLRLAFCGYQNLSILRQDFYKSSLGDAALVVCYLYPGAMHILRGKFETELKPGTTVISNTFAISGWHPAAVHEIDDLYRTKLYVYIIGPKTEDRSQ